MIKDRIDHNVRACGTCDLERNPNRMISFSEKRPVQVSMLPVCGSGIIIEVDASRA